MTTSYLDYAKNDQIRYDHTDNDTSSYVSATPGSLNYKDEYVVKKISVDDVIDEKAL